MVVSFVLSRNSMSVNNSQRDAVAPCTRQAPMRSEARAGAVRQRFSRPVFAAALTPRGGTDRGRRADGVPYKRRILEVRMKRVDPKVDEAIQTLNMGDSPTRRKLLAGTGLVSATAAASALLAACSSNSSSAASAGSGKNPFPAVPNQKYYFVNHADTNEFFTPTKYGFADAAALLGIPTPVWSGSANSVDSEMISAANTAVSAKAAGIATSVIDSSMATPVKNAMDAGIPVVTYNADGIYKNGVPQIYTNRLAYVGQALYLSGQAMGE